MDVVFGDGSLGIKKNGIRYIFSYSSFGLISLNKEGHEFIYRPPKPAFWRATTCNDRANGFCQRSAMWMGADSFPINKDFSLFIDGINFNQNQVFPPLSNNLINSPFRNATDLILTFNFLTATNPIAECKISYHLKDNTDGIDIEFSYFGQKGLPELPICGLRFILTELCNEYKYKGLKGETYPDRMSFRDYGEYIVKGDSDCPYILPQEYGMHIKSSYANISFSKGHYLCLENNENNLNFSIIPYTPLELESAFHVMDLPPKRRSVITVVSSTRGVGGINTWGADVESNFHMLGDGIYHTKFKLI